MLSVPLTEVFVFAVPPFSRTCRRVSSTHPALGFPWPGSGRIPRKKPRLAAAEAERCAMSARAVKQSGEFKGRVWDYQLYRWVIPEEAPRSPTPPSPEVGCTRGIAWGLFENFGGSPMDG